MQYTPQILQPLEDYSFQFIINRNERKSTMTFHALVVDDNQNILDDVKDRLESLGHTCDQASSQVEAKTLLAENRYTYVLLDLAIPVKSGSRSRITNGENLLWTIRRTKGFEDIPIIVMTSQGHYRPLISAFRH